MENNVKLIIAGGRDFSDYKLLETEALKFIDEVVEIQKHPSIEVVSGRARGADSLGEQFANTHKLPVKVFPANWNKYGRSAGYKRNLEMADYATHLIAFWDGKSKGTKHMIQTGIKNKLSVKVINY